MVCQMDTLWCSKRWDRGEQHRSKLGACFSFLFYFPSDITTSLRSQAGLLTQITAQLHYSFFFTPFLNANIYQLAWPSQSKGPGCLSLLCSGPLKGNQRILEQFQLCIVPSQDTSYSSDLPPEFFLIFNKTVNRTVNSTGFFFLKHLLRRRT